MNYYIQGSAARAEQIKAAFEKLGYRSAYVFNAEMTLYFTFNGEIKTAVANSYKSIIKTHPDYKELELPIEPKFKVGDKVIYGGKERTITFMDDKFYDFDGGCAGCRIELQDGLLRPVPRPHYDIANFKPFDKVLVRFCDGANWCCALFSHYCTRGNNHFVCSGGSVTQCIPFEGNDHLLGTTDMPSEEYINW